MLVPRLPHWGIISSWVDGSQESFEWSENIPLAYPAKCKKRPTTRDRKRDATEHDIIKFLILAQNPLTVRGLAAMLGTGCNKVADASFRLEEAGIVKRARRSRMVFLNPPK
jgi:hypothetical protein